jgi:hypothetical protein
VSSFQQIFSYWPPEEPDEFVPPAWFAPPQMELGESVPVALVVSRSERAVVALRQVIAYSTGVHLEFVALARGPSQREANNLFHDQHRMAGEEPPAELLRIGVELSDGARISNLGSPHHRFWQPDRTPHGPLLVPYGGGGGSAGSGRVSLTPGHWLWPLLPLGPLRVFTEWPALGVELSSVDLDATPILEAAKRSQKLWPE